MSTHNKGFYEDLTKIIFELSSNIIKCAPYSFCCNANWLFSLYWCVGVSAVSTDFSQLLIELESPVWQLVSVLILN